MSDDSSVVPETPDTPAVRLLAALRDAALPGSKRTFTSTELGYLMGLAARWAREDRDGEPDPLSYRAGVRAGYLQRVAEENAAYPPPQFGVATSAGYDAIQVHRKRAQVDVRYVRDGDYRGGSVPPW